MRSGGRPLRAREHDMQRLAQTTLVSLLLVAGCGDDDRPAAGTDAGPRADSGGSTGDGGGTAMMTIRRRLLAAAPTVAARTPIEGVHVAFDLAGARYEGTTDAMGNVDVMMPRATTIDAATAAKERYSIVTELDGPGVAVGAPAESDRVDVVLFPTTPAGNDVRVLLNATGVPTGGRWCAGPAEWYATCADEGMRIDVTVGDDSIEPRVTAIAIDASGAAVDFAEATLAGTGTADHTATFAFDGTPAVTPITRTVTLQLPSDPASIYRTAGLLEPDEARPFIAVEPMTHLMRSVVTPRTRAADGSSYSMTVTVFPAPGDPPVWAMAAYTAPRGEAFGYRWFAGDLDQPSYTLLDGPRVTGRPAMGVYTFAYTWTASTGADRYALQLVNNAGTVVWAVFTTRTMDIQLPALPTGYDMSVSFPFAGANGYAQVRALRGTLPDRATAMAGTEPFRVDADVTLGPREPITF